MLVLLGWMLSENLTNYKRKAIELPGVLRGQGFAQLRPLAMEKSIAAICGSNFQRACGTPESRYAGFAGASLNGAW